MKKLVGCWVTLSILAALNLTLPAHCAAAKAGRIDRHARTELITIFDTMHRTCGVGYFRRGQLSNDTLIRFGMVYAIHTGNFEPVRDTTYQIPGTYVKHVAMRFFGRTVALQSVPESTGQPAISYRRGNFRMNFPNGNNESDPEHIRMTRIVSLGHNQYLAYVSYYDRLGNMRLTGKEKATFQAVGSHDQRHFVVLDYSGA